MNPRFRFTIYCCAIALSSAIWSRVSAATLAAKPSQRTLARTFVLLLADGEYATAQRLLGPPLSATMPTSNLRAVWRGVRREHGDWLAIVAVDSVGEEAHGAQRVVVVAVHCRFRRGAVQVRTSFTEGRITSLWVIPDTVSRAQRRALDEVDSLAAAEFAKDSVGGLTIGMWVAGHLAWTGTYGWADRSSGQRAARETVYRIGSVSKMLTALALLQLAERGNVSLRDPVTKYLPEFGRIAGADTGPPVTLLNLSTHTSGLAREPDSLSRFGRGPVEHWMDTLLAALPHTRFTSTPGTAYSYSNIGYAILGAALSRAAGMAYTSYLRERVLVPLGMTHSSFAPPPQSVLARGYQVGSTTLDSITPAREHAGRGYRVPNGALYSTVDDLAAIIAHVLGQGPDDVLADSTRQLIFAQRSALNDGLTADYGVGYEVFDTPGGTFFGHGGAVVGYTAGLIFDPKSRTGLVVLRNANGGNFDMGELAFRALARVAVASEVR